MSHALLLWLPLAGFALLTFTGAGLAVVLGRRYPADAQGALAPLVGAAAFVCASPLVHLGVPARPVGVTLVALLGWLTLLLGRDVARALRAGTVPLAVMLAALTLVSLPALTHGSWSASTIENSDPYLWVSQAKAFLDGPPPGSSDEFPDRIAYERIAELRWPVGLPFGVAQVASLAQRDPADVYGAFAAVVAVLLSLAVYTAARACLEWSRRRSAVGALLVAANALMLYSTFNGWQAQLALTVFGLLAVFSFRLALDAEALARERILAGLFAAAAVGTYGVLFGPFVLVIAAAIVGHAVAARSVEWRRYVRVALGAAASFLAFGLWSAIQGVRQLGVLLSLTDPAAWASYPHGLPAEALGLIPRIGTAQRPPTTWSVIALGATALLLAFAVFLPGASQSRSRRDVLLTAGAVSFAAILLLQLPGPSPYESIKIAAYSAPFLTLLALSGLAARGPFPRIRVATAAVAGSCFVVSTAMVMWLGLSHLQWSEPLAGVRQAVATVPAEEPVAIAVRDGWKQSWSVYYLRDRRTVVVNPIEPITGFGIRISGRRGNARYVVDHADSSPAVWRGYGIMVRRQDLRQPATRVGERRGLASGRLGEPD